MAFTARLRPPPPPFRSLPSSLVVRRTRNCPFHTTVSAAAPKARRLLYNPPSQTANVVRDQDSINFDDPRNLVQTIPDTILQAAIDDGRIDVPLKVARDVSRFLCHNTQIVRGLFPIRDEVFDFKYNGESLSLTSIARIYVALSYSKPHRGAAFRGLRSLAVNGSEPLSTMATALFYRSDPKADPVERRRYEESLFRLANQRTHPHAMMLYSYFCPDKDSLYWLKCAHEAACPIPRDRDYRPGKTQPAPLVRLLPPEVPAPWHAYADALAKRPKEAMDAIKVGMDKFDAPLAYEKLAERLMQDMRAGESVNLADYENYLLKSAMHHNGSSCYLLGNLYLTIHLESRADLRITYGRDSEPFARRHPDDYYRMLAVEWYELAIQAAIIQPTLILAALWRQEGKPLEPVEAYLKLAEYDEGCASKAREMRDRWTDKNFRLDIPELMV